MREDWVEIKLGDICEIVSGKNQKAVTSPSGKYPIYGSGGIFGRANEYLCEPGTTIIGRKGTINNPIYVNQRFWNVDTAFGISPSKEIVSKYVFYFCKGFNFHKLDKSTTIPSLAKRDLLVIELKLAPLPEQRAIVSKIEQLFSELDHGIANLQAAKDKLEIYRQAVLKKAFEGELTKEWREHNPYSEKDLDKLLEHIKNFNDNKSGRDIPRRLPPIDLSDLHKLPYGWLWQEAHKICSSVRDGTHDTPNYVDAGVPLVTSKNLKGGVIDMENVNFISESDHEEICRRSAVEENDILYGMIGTIGNPVIVRQTNAFIIKNIGLFKKNDTHIIPKFFQYYLSSWVVNHIMRQKELIRGTTQKFVSLGGLRVLPLPIPSKSEQEQIIYEIESRLSVCDNILDNIEEGLEKSEALRHSILKQAFEGKLLSEEELEACKKEADWEPAEQLLERIKNEKEV